jgi:ATP-dependent DNA ligase
LVTKPSLTGRIYHERSLTGTERDGFTPAGRARLVGRLKPFEIPTCPFANLPESRSDRWGEGLTSEKMKECVWVRPKLTAEVEFVEWTQDVHLRHARFVRMLGEVR